VPHRLRYIACLAAAFALLVTASAAALPSLARNPANALVSRGIDPLRYDPATHCTGKNTAGALALVGWLERNAAGVNWGIYRCEMWGKHSASLHAEGRAVDWHPASKAAAYALIRLLLAPDKAGNPVALARRMGIQGLIYDCKAWWSSPDGQLGQYSYCYGKNGKRRQHLDPTQAHMDHVHIELNKAGAVKKTTFWDRKLVLPVQPTPQPSPRPADPEPSPPAQDPGYGNGGGTWNDGGNWNGGGGQWGGPGADPSAP
jgi:hypothetical protein